MTTECTQLHKENDFSVPYIKGKIYEHMTKTKEIILTVLCQR